MDHLNEILSAYKYPILISLVGLVLVFSGYFSSNMFAGSKTEIKKELPKESIVKNETSLIKADISGAVVNPGVYSLEKDSRIEDLIKRAGGLRTDANAEFISKSLNLSQKISDGLKVYIPFKDEKVGGSTAIMGVSTSSGGGAISGAAAASGGKVSINNGSEKDLEDLPGIGPATAAKIIGGRPYSDLNDLVSKKTVGKATFEKIKDLVDL